MNSPDPHLNKISNLRRSQRVCLSIPVLVVKKEAGKPAVSEESHTLIVSAHGALLALSMPVKFGDALTIKHKKTEEELACRVASFGPGQSGKREVGVEFEKPSPRFWRIAFPPADWSPRGPDSKPPTAQVPGAASPLKKPAAVPTDSSKARGVKTPGTASR